ncbi:hypothetical protein [Marinimicrobium alkaliphilum]|uniref:hypothetical protein n=1 Tax=Marinimicrobium alkaliphilum TaxID=2202654 RepID=UPI000DBA979F|nr:hypothetical protein [Marinimicrobium alkaliphilum]
MNKTIMQLKRELWECRASFIRTPIILAGLLMLLLIVGQVTVQFKLGDNFPQPDVSNTEVESSGNGLRLQLSDDRSYEIDAADLHKLKSGELYSSHPQLLGAALGMIHIVFALVLLPILSVYFLGSLYSDRRDQSVFFWKSLPVTERRNVLTKLAAGVLGAPIFFGAAALATGIFYLVLISVYTGVFLNLPLPGLGHILSSFLGSIASLVAGWLMMSLWALPIFCWLMFCSALAKKVPFLMALGIPLALVVLEFWALGSRHIGSALGDQAKWALASLGKVIPFPDQIGIQALQMLAEPALWIGWLISALLLAASIWLRNYRYEI